MSPPKQGLTRCGTPGNCSNYSTAHDARDYTILIPEVPEVEPEVPVSRRNIKRYNVPVTGL